MDKKKKLLEEEEPVTELTPGASRMQKVTFWIVTVVAIAGGLFHMYTGGLARCRPCCRRCCTGC